MISLLSVRLPRLVAKVLMPLFLFCFIMAVVVTHSGGNRAIFESRYRQMKSYLDGTLFSDGPAAIIEPQNVRISFKATKKGTKEQILEQNQAIYDKVLAQEIDEPKDFDMESIRPPEDLSSYVHANATIVALARNNEINGIQRTMRQFEKSFNSKFLYPYTFINDQPFDEKFKARIRSFTSAPVEFVQIPAELWDKPDTIDAEKERVAMDKLVEQNVAYAKTASYHNMCRFYSGLFHKVPELQKYRYYWRIEPSVKFYTDLKYDVFKYFEGTGKIYGFTIGLYDIRQSVETLFSETMSFLNTGDNYKYVNPNGAFQWVTENQQNPLHAETTGGFSTCHFWSNFEIGDMDFFRGEAYSSWFDHLDSTGKFYYERWGDAPVHSLGLSLFADKSKIHWFRDIGYYHAPYFNCPKNKKTKGCKAGRFDTDGNTNDQNCMATWIDYEMDNLGSVY